MEQILYNIMCLVSVTNARYTVASALVVVGSVFRARFRLILGQCRWWNSHLLALCDRANVVFTNKRSQAKVSTVYFSVDGV